MYVLIDFDVFCESVVEVFVWGDYVVVVVVIYFVGYDFVIEYGVVFCEIIGGFLVEFWYDDLWIVM